MTTLTPEKEAEEAVRRYVQMRTEKPLRGVDDSIHGLHKGTEWEAELKLADLRNVLSLLSTERQAREAAEKAAQSNYDDAKAYAETAKWQRERAEAAEKEVERLEAECIQKCINCQVAWEAKVAALSALPPPVPTEEGGELKPCPFCGGKSYYTESVNGSSMAYVGCASCGISAKAALVPGRAPGSTEWSKDLRAAWNTRPTQAPQDVAGLVEELAGVIEPIAERWIYRTAHRGPEHLCTGIARDAANAILSALRASPISHEDRPLELAAADNNREALVEALDEARDALSEAYSRTGHPDDLAAAHLADVASAAARQQGGAS